MHSKTLVSAPARVCIFGDSHFVALRRAVDEGLVEMPGFELVWRGHAGHRFRQIEFRGSVIEATDEATAAKFSRSKGCGREIVDSRKFDVVLFAGCRLTIANVFADILNADRTPGSFYSSGLKRDIVRWCLEGFKTYQFAQKFAQIGHARILFAPVSFPTSGGEKAMRADCPAAYSATKAERDAIWQIFHDTMEEDGIELIVQPEVTVTQGCLTDPKFGVDGYIEKNDHTHKNAAYGALVLESAKKLINVPRGQAALV